MATFNELLSSIKELLRDRLNGDNLELFTEVDKKLDDLSDSHKKTEEDLSSTKDKLIEIVKDTSFKNSEPEGNQNATQPDVMDIDSALDLAIQETISQRR